MLAVLRVALVTVATFLTMVLGAAMVIEDGTDVAGGDKDAATVAARETFRVEADVAVWPVTVSLVDIIGRGVSTTEGTWPRVSDTTDGLISVVVLGSEVAILKLMVLGWADGETEDLGAGAGVIETRLGRVQDGALEVVAPRLMAVMVTTVLGVRGGVDGGTIWVLAVSAAGLGAGAGAGGLGLGSVSGVLAEPSVRILACVVCTTPVSLLTVAVVRGKSWNWSFWICWTRSS